MKIQCEKCQAVYNVPDEKIQGRPIRFTCKRCGNVVRYKPEQSSKMTMEMSAADVGPRMTGEMSAMSQEDENAKTVFEDAKVAKVREEIDQKKAEQEARKVEPPKFSEPQPRMTIEGKPLEQQPVANGPSIWYVAYSKNKRGPMSIEQIQQHLFETDVNGEIYVWKSGFDSWKRMQEVGEFAGVWAALEAKKSGQPIQVPSKAAPVAEKPARPSFSDLLKSELGDVEEKKPQPSSQKIDISELMTKEVKEPAEEKKEEPAKAKMMAPVVMEEYRPPEKKKFPLKAVLTLLFLLIVVVATPLTLAYKEIIDIPFLEKVPVIGVYFKKVEVDHYAQLRAQWEMLVKIDETKIAMQATKEEEEKARLEAEKQKALEEKRARIARAAQRKRAGGGAASQNVTSFDFGDGEDGTEMDTIGELNTTNIKREAVLDQSQVNAVIRKNMGQIASCVKGQKEYGESVMGTMNVRFTISRRGSVVRANVLTDKFKGTYVADCVAATIERLKFPKSGASMTVSYPFSIK